MEERGLVGLEARTPDGDGVGRISEVLTDEETEEVTHVMVEREDRQFEVPISALSLDPESDFATFHADRSDEEPGDHAGNEIETEEATPLEPDVEDTRHEGQLVPEPESEEEAQSEADLVREDWEGETHTPVDSGYRRTGAYIDLETREAEVDPTLNKGEELCDYVERLLLDETGLETRAVKDGVVELTGAVSTRQDLEETLEELMGLGGVQGVDTTDVDVGQGGLFVTTGSLKEPGVSFSPLSSREWLEHFQDNEQPEVLSEGGSGLTAAEREAVIPSIQEFQLGEHSEGKNLHRCAKEYAEENEDPEYLQAMEYFIREEQRHARYLRDFLASEGFGTVKKRWADSVFRKLRSLAGLEISVAVLVTEMTRWGRSTQDLMDTLGSSPRGTSR